MDRNRTQPRRVKRRCFIVLLVVAAQIFLFSFGTGLFRSDEGRLGRESAPQQASGIESLAEAAPPGCPIKNERDLKNFKMTFPDPRPYCGPNDNCFYAASSSMEDFDAEHDILWHPIPDFDYNVSNSGKPGGVAAFRNAFLAGDTGQVYNCHISWLPGGCEEELAEPSQFYGEKVYINGTVVALQQTWGIAYYHSITEDFLRVAMVYSHVIKHPEIKFLISLEYPMMQYMFSLINIDAQRLIPLQMEKTYYAENALVPAASDCGKLRPASGKFLRRLMRTNFFNFNRHSLPSSQAFHILVQERPADDTRGRSIINHKEMVSALKAAFPDAIIDTFLGTESPELTFQKHAISNLIIAPHGAGLSHLLLVPEDAAVVEIHPSIEQVWCYEYSALGLELRYEKIIGQSQEGGIRVNASQVVEVSRELVNQPLDSWRVHLKQFQKSNKNKIL
ncbi:hypothetical protein BJ741DRAFT_648707 [Chytriomyces cf. hyalinus JEL632]|nr:hypothetical protein BJ741DRAFT_648707 [Chytriomyces cf. hyalinus JEL632]